MTIDARHPSELVEGDMVLVNDAERGIIACRFVKMNWTVPGYGGMHAVLTLADRRIMPFTTDLMLCLRP